MKIKNVHWFNSSLVGMGEKREFLAEARRTRRAGCFESAGVLAGLLVTYGFLMNQ